MSSCIPELWDDTEFLRKKKEEKESIVIWKIKPGKISLSADKHRVMHTGEKHKANNLGDDDLLANNLYSETKS